MYQKILRLSILTAILAIAVMGCKKDDPNQTTGNMQNVVLKGVVNDTNGNPLSGVKVITGTVDATTDSKGEFSFTQAEVIDKRAVIKFEKSGYFTLTRSREKESDMFIDAVLYSKGNSDISLQTTFDASKETTLNVGGMKVALSASSVVRADGSAHSGTVNANMLYLDPNNENFAGLMPGGDLMAIRDNGSECMLISYGMTNVLLTDNSGNPLQLKSGAPAEVTFPIPAGMENGAPASIPLWHFDEEKGIWMEDGVATLQDEVYVGTVAHFSWVNLDVPAQRVTIKGKVTDCNGEPIPCVKITVEETYVYANSVGNYSIFVPEYTPVSMVVKSKDYGYYSPEKSYNISGQSGGSIVTQDISLPCLEEGWVIDGKIGNLAWSLNMTNGILTISGNGAMKGYTFHYDVPWYKYREAISTVVLETGVTSIGQRAFWTCTNLTSITIPNSVTSIEYGFFGCTSLTSITIPNSVTYIYEADFFKCTNLISINVENGNNTYASENGVLFNKNKTTLIRCPEGKAGAYVVPSSVTSIGGGSFMHCTNLSSIIIPNSVTTIGSFAFHECTSLTSITIPNSITTIEEYTFFRCTMPSITIPNSVTSIGKWAFYECTNLTSISIPNNVITIEDGAFDYCTGLISITIGYSVEKIGSQAIPCNGLQDIYSLAIIPPTAATAFTGVNNTTFLHVQTGCIDAYKKADGWKNFKNIVEE